MSIIDCSKPLPSHRCKSDPASRTINDTKATVRIETYLEVRTYALNIFSRSFRASSSDVAGIKPDIITSGMARMAEVRREPTS